MGIKLEIGSGMRPRPGYQHLDLYSKHPCIEYHEDARKMSFKDGEVSEIYSLNTIEHFWWYEIEDLLREWCRVLEKGGRAEIWTVDCDVKIREYLDGSWKEHVKAHPKENGYTWPHRTDTDRNMWFNWCIHSTGIAGDAHHTSFNYEMMEDLLKRAGFTKVNRIKTTPYILAVEAYK